MSVAKVLYGKGAGSAQESLVPHPGACRQSRSLGYNLGWGAFVTLDTIGLGVGAHFASIFQA